MNCVKEKGSIPRVPRTLNALWGRCCFWFLGSFFGSGNQTQDHVLISRCCAAELSSAQEVLQFGVSSILGFLFINLLVSALRFWSCVSGLGPISYAFLKNKLRWVILIGYRVFCFCFFLWHRGWYPGPTVYVASVIPVSYISSLKSVFQ